MQTASLAGYPCLNRKTNEISHPLEGYELAPPGEGMSLVAAKSGKAFLMMYRTARSR